VTGEECYASTYGGNYSGAKLPDARSKLSQTVSGALTMEVVQAIQLFSEFFGDVLIYLRNCEKICIERECIVRGDHLTERFTSLAHD
jgi:hypothetical protein